MLQQVENTLRKLLGNEYDSIVILETDEDGCTELHMHSDKICRFPNRDLSEGMVIHILEEQLMGTSPAQLLFQKEKSIIRYLFDYEAISVSEDVVEHIAFTCSSKKSGKKTYHLLRKVSDDFYAEEVWMDPKEYWDIISSFNLEKDVKRASNAFDRPVILRNGGIIVPKSSIGECNKELTKISLLQDTEYREYTVVDGNVFLQDTNNRPNWADEYLERKPRDVNPSLSTKLQEVLLASAYPDARYKGDKLVVTNTYSLWAKTERGWISIGGSEKDVEYSLKVLGEDIYAEYVIYTTL